MKYIKTKDNAIHKVIESCKPFYEVIDGSVEFLYVYSNPSDGTEIYGDSGYHRHDIVREADTIDELCDKFVFETSIGMEIRTSCVESKAYISRYKKVYPAFIKKAYGAVWTNKGLIYVAKMNEKGEWKLL